MGNYRFQHSDVVGELVDALGVQSQSPRTDGYQIRVGERVSAGEQRNFMPLSNQFFGQVRDNPFCSSIQFWRDTLIQRRNLRDSHKNNSPDLCTFGWDRCELPSPTATSVRSLMRR